MKIQLYPLSLCIFFSILWSSPLHAQSIEQLLPSPTDVSLEGDLQSIAFDESGRVAYAVGDCGTVMKTEDAGLTWTKLAFPENDRLLQVELVTNTEGQQLFVRGYSRVFESKDGGESWQQRSTDNLMFASILNMAVLDDQTVLLMMSDLTMVRLFDEQEEVIHLDLEAEFSQSNRIDFVDDQNGWLHLRLINGGQAVFRSQDGGRQWNKVESWPLADRTILNFDFIDEQTGYILTDVDGDPEMMQTKDGGKSWEPFVQPGSTFLSIGNQFVAVDEQEVWTFNFTQLRRYFKDDQGNTSEEIIPIDVQFNRNVFTSAIGIALAPNRSFWYAGPNQVILELPSGERSWKFRNGQSDTQIFDVHFPAPDHIVAYGHPSNIYHSYDNGDSWEVESIRMPFTVRVIQAMPLAQDRHLVAIQGRGLLLLDADRVVRDVLNTGSFDYRMAQSPISKTLYSLSPSFFGSSELHRSVNGGLEWELLHTFNFRATDIEIPAEGILYVSGGQGDLDKSTDGGRSWESVLTNEDMFIQDISFSTPQHGYIAGSPFSLYTEDGGKTFEPLSFRDVPTLNRVVMGRSSIGWGLGLTGFIGSDQLLSTRDGGNNWLKVAESCANLLDIRFNPHTEELWMLSTWGALYRYEQRQFSTPLTPESQNQLSLYPVPATDFLTMEIPTQGRQLERGRLYDSQGRLLQEFPLSDQRFTFLPVGELPTGLYLLEVVGEDISRVEKFIKQ
ncbi:MAG: T9SS type A sorting domain-containing protein [Bacteroidota bacterium]